MEKNEKEVEKRRRKIKDERVEEKEWKRRIGKGLVKEEKREKWRDVERSGKKWKEVERCRGEVKRSEGKNDLYKKTTQGGDS